jgi:hypothetical protein
MSESLTRRKNAANRRKAAGFISESRPASRRNKSESESPKFAAHARKASRGPIWLKGRKFLR